MSAEYLRAQMRINRLGPDKDSYLYRVCNSPEESEPWPPLLVELAALSDEKIRQAIKTVKDRDSLCEFVEIEREAWEQQAKALESEYEQHPLCKLVPSMSGEDYENLRDDIAEHGLRDSIVTYENKILDGWNRYRAMRELGQEFEKGAIVPFDPTLDGSSPEAFVLSRNLHRRHLTAGQKANLAKEMADTQEMRCLSSVEHSTFSAGPTDQTRQKTIYPGACAPGYDISRLRRPHKPG